MCGCLCSNDSNQRSKYKYIFKSAEKGDAFGNYLLSEFFSARNNPKRALEYLQNAARIGYPLAISKLGEKYLTGSDDLKKDKKKAISYFKRSIRSCELSIVHYANFCFEKKDIKTGIRVLENAFKSKFTAVAHELGLMYHTGKYVEKDYIKALMWLNKSVKHHNFHSYEVIGDIY